MITGTLAVTSILSLNNPIRLPKSSAAFKRSLSSGAFCIGLALLTPSPCPSTTTISDCVSPLSTAVKYARTSCWSAIFLSDNSLSFSLISFFISGFFRFSIPIEYAVFLLYPAFTAASVAFPLMIYSSANLCCFKVNLIYHQLLS